MCPICEVNPAAGPDGRCANCPSVRLDSYRAPGWPALAASALLGSVILLDLVDAAVSWAARRCLWGHCRADERGGTGLREPVPPPRRCQQPLRTEVRADFSAVSTVRW